MQRFDFDKKVGVLCNCFMFKYSVSLLYLCVSATYQVRDCDT